MMNSGPEMVIWSVVVTEYWISGHAFILGLKSKGVALKVMRTFAIK
jgi:hypothetical protein